MERPMHITSREELIFLLSQASELEHGLLCTYLFAAFSLKNTTGEGVTAEELEAIARWRTSIYSVATQEMLHLTIASNLLTAIGAAPHFRRPNFPQQSSYYPPAFKLALLPFDDETLQHFIYMERPEGMQVADVFDLFPEAALSPLFSENEIGPDAQDFMTVGHLYRSIEAGLRNLVEKFGEQDVFIGPSRAQATQEFFRFPELQPVTDLASAISAIELIVEEGEGARGDWKNAHFGRFLKIQEEYRTLRQQNPDFQPARPVLPNPFARVPSDTAHVNIITDPYTIQVSDLFNACYEVMLELLARFFAHTGETGEELHALANTAISMMLAVIQPLGTMLTSLPAGDEHSGFVAGPSFEFYRTIHLLPHKHAAWLIFHERLVELAAYAARLQAHAEPPPGLENVQRSLQRLANVIEKYSVRLENND